MVRVHRYCMYKNEIHFVFTIRCILWYSDILSPISSASDPEKGYQADDGTKVFLIFG